MAEPGREGSLDEEAALHIGAGPQGAFALDANLVATGRTCVLGSSGSGKSYAVGVICEELCRKGVPFAIIDTEGEHTGLKEKFDVIWVGEEPGSDLSWERLDVRDLARQAPDIAPLILDVSELEDARQRVGEFVEELYGTLTERRTPYLLVIEEADKFVPQAGERTPIFGDVARRGRKRGLGLMVCSQRPSLIDKNVLSQCGNQLIGKLIIQNDLQSVAQFFPGKGVPKGLTSLRPGEFFAMGGFAAPPILIRVKERATRPGGVTPTLSRRAVRRYTGAFRTEASSRGGAPTEEDRGRPLGLVPAMREEDVPMMVKRERSFGIFGTKETVTSVTPSYRTMVQLGVRSRRGLLKKRFQTTYFHLDGITGKQVTVGKGLVVGPGLQRLLGLSALQVEVLRRVSPDSDTSAIDIASAIGEPRGTVSRMLSILNDKRLVRTTEVRRAKLYRRLVDIPPLPSGENPLDLTRVEAGKARILEPKVSEAEVREVVKGLWEGADLESFEPFLYPTFVVELNARRKRRLVTIDGRTGDELRL